MKDNDQISRAAIGAELQAGAIGVGLIGCWAFARNFKIKGENMEVSKKKTDMIVDKMLDGILAESDPVRRKGLVEEFQIFSHSISMGFQHTSYSTAYPVSEDFSDGA